jgi:hypothetical protein
VVVGGTVLVVVVLVDDSALPMEPLRAVGAATVLVVVLVAQAEAARARAATAHTARPRLGRPLTVIPRTTGRSWRPGVGGGPRRRRSTRR